MYTTYLLSVENRLREDGQLVDTTVSPKLRAYLTDSVSVRQSVGLVAMDRGQDVLPMWKCTQLLSVENRLRANAQLGVTTVSPKAGAYLTGSVRV